MKFIKPVIIWLTVRAVFYGGMCLMTVFAIGRIIAWVYGIHYQTPSAFTVIRLSVYFSLGCISVPFGRYVRKKLPWLETIADMLYPRMTGTIAVQIVSWILFLITMLPLPILIMLLLQYKEIVIGITFFGGVTSKRFMNWLNADH